MIGTLISLTFVIGVLTLLSWLGPVFAALMGSGGGGRK